MPPKSLYSVNENAFSMRRNMFVNQMQVDQNQTNTVLKEKKFYGNSNNRDASNIISKRAITGTNSSFPMNGQVVSHEGSSSKVDSQKALNRVRSSGYIVPAKKSNTAGVPNGFIFH